ncbi:hypothetical protein BGW80DRAFT_1248713 [Lactifluus volemus]|nr:hypothetical protein BGW80DRAFT_1248713 [Lactifluus volemus]
MPITIVLAPDRLFIHHADDLGAISLLNTSAGGGEHPTADIDKTSITAAVTSTATYDATTADGICPPNIVPLFHDDITRVFAAEVPRRIVSTNADRRWRLSNIVSGSSWAGGVGGTNNGGSGGGGAGET